MALTPAHATVRHLMRWLVWLATFGLTALAWAQDLTFSATVDTTTAHIGDPINLVITLSGDIAGVELPAFEFPEGFAVLGRSQATNFSIRNGAMERSTNLTFVLVPQQAGTFHLGPLSIQKGKQTLQTETIEITVKKPPVPPGLKLQGDRFTL